MQKLGLAAISVATLCISLSAAAALPQTGMWGIDSEVNGLPGRGIQIDRQDGLTVIASYYGYRSDGSATFYQAVGKITDGKTLIAELVEYKNGPSLGGKPTSGEVARTIGPMVMEFDTASSGSVTLPGEPSKRISPLVYEDHRERLNNSFRVARTEYLLGVEPANLHNLRMQIQGNDIRIETGWATVSCSFIGPLVATGQTFSVSAEGGCVSAGITTKRKIFEDIRVNEAGKLLMKVRDVKLDTSSDKDPLKGDFFGVCVLPLRSIRDIQTVATPCIMATQ